MIDKLELLQSELNMRNAPEERKKQLQQLLAVADSRLRKKGITLDDNDAGDVFLVVELAAWLYRRRAQGESKAMPRYLQLDIHDRLVAQKAKVTDGT